MIYWEPILTRAESEHWSAVHLEHPKLKLPLEEFRVEIFRNIGAMIEGCVKPALGQFLAQLRISRGKIARSEDILSQKFGNLVAEIFDTFSNKELIAPSPWKIRLNQWRNIAQHHGTFLRQEKIVAVYGEGGGKQEIELEREEAFLVGTRVADILRALNAARRILLWELEDEFRGRFPLKEVREEAKTIELSSALATQGFFLVDITDGEDEIAIHLNDTTDLDWNGRAAHSSQFVLMTWILFKRSNVVIVLISKDRSRAFRMTAKGSDIEQVVNKTISFEALAPKVRFEPFAPNK